MLTNKPSGTVIDEDWAAITSVGSSSGAPANHAAKQSFIESRMRDSISERADQLPHPGEGRTLLRWKALAEAGAQNLSFAKVFESHVDALAILKELGGPVVSRALWAVWAAEPPGEPLELNSANYLVGQKSWCSAAEFVDYALVTVRRGEERLLASVSLRQPGVTVHAGNWKAVGMRDTQSAVVTFDGAAAEVIGKDRAYSERPGFWHGGAGIAAVWFGAACAIGEKLSRSPAVHRDPHAAAHLGAIDVALAGAKAVLEGSAAWIDEQPNADAMAVALRTRATVEAAANEVLLRTGRALGPSPLCVDAHHAQRCVDLEIFLRQSHAERDLEALGRRVAGDVHWRL